jgi:rSAM/selenodomain-associated transferase 2
VTADIDVVIPTVNAARSLALTLNSLGGDHGLRLSFTVCDGGSRDDTTTIARQAGATVMVTEAGRGRQLADGAAAGSAPWLLFLHADTTLSMSWAAAARQFMTLPAHAPKAGYFRLRFDSADSRARRIERLTAWRCRTFGLPYGDQGLLIERAFYRQLGGFRALPLMEDVDLARRIGRRRLVALDAEAMTSAERYERDGWLARPMRNLGCLALYFAGLSPSVIRRLYGS